MIGEGIGLLGGPGPTAIHDDARGGCEHLTLHVGQRRDVEAERTSLGDLPLELGVKGGDLLGSDNPTADVRGPSLPRERLELLRRDRAALADDAVDRSVRSRLAHRANGRDLDDLTAADGLRAPALAEDEAIAGEEGHRLRDAQPHPPGCAGLDRVGADHAQLGGMLTGSDRGDVRAAPRDRVSEVVERGELRIEHARWAPLLGTHHRHATSQGVTVDSRDVDGNSVARADASPRLTERLERADPTGGVPGLDHDVVVDGESAAGEGARDDGAGTPRGEDPIDPQPRPPPIDRAWSTCDESIERPEQLVHARAGGRGGLDHFRRFEERARDMVADVETGKRGVIRVDEIDLREGDHPVRDPEQLEDAQVLLALRLPSFGRGDDEKAGVYRTDAGEHVLDEAHVARDVDERDALRRTAAAPTRTRGRW